MHPIVDASLPNSSLPSPEEPVDQAVVEPGPASDEADGHAAAHGLESDDVDPSFGSDQEPRSGEPEEEAQERIQEKGPETEPTGRVIDFPVQPVRGHEPEAEDILDPFGAGPSIATARGSTPAPILYRESTEAPTEEDPLGEFAPPLDEEESSDDRLDEAERLSREFDERIGYDETDADADTGLIPALPTGGVPPRPAMPSLRSAPLSPPRPLSPPPAMSPPGAMASPASIASAAPPVRPSLAPAGDAGTRLAPRPVAVRPPGM
jgi:hypothetical protein